MKKVIKLEDKQEIILKHFREGKSQRQIHRDTGIARETIRKYIRQYEESLLKLQKSSNDIQKVDLIDELVNPPKYKCTTRKKSALSEEVIDKLKLFLKENEEKRLSGLSKQQMKKVDMHEALLEEGFQISYTTVVNAVNKIQRKSVKLT